MKISEKSLLHIAWFTICCCFAILLFLSLGSCSSSRKDNSQLSVSSESFDVMTEDSAAFTKSVNVFSGLSLNVSVDSVKFFPLRIIAEKENPPDSSNPDVPLVAAAYGINMSAVSSDSLAASSKAVSQSKNSESALSSNASIKEVSQQKSDGGKSCIISIVVFIFCVLAVSLAIRSIYRNKYGA